MKRVGRWSAGPTIYVLVALGASVLLAGLAGALGGPWAGLATFAGVMALVLWLAVMFLPKRY
jgi:hypothetical protein